jgi:stage III sporulation protein AE
MIAAGQGVSRVCADLILPFMNVFLGVSITSGISNEVRLNSFLSLISKTVKWLLAFVMTVFTAVLSMRQIAAGAVDSVASRTAKFALSSFVPMVGSALAEAYRSVQGSVSVLKSGLGIFVIAALAVTFLPLILRAFLWLVCLSIGKTFAVMLGISQCAGLLEAIGAVFSAIIAVLFCVMTVFIISAAAAFTIGGGA